MVGGAHGPLVVLDHDHGVAEVAQPLQRRDQARVVALMEADRGLVEDVEHADEARSDLGGQPDPLRLAAREGRRGALERQVAHADVVEEAQPLVDLAQDQPSDLTLGVRELELLEPADRPPRGHARDLVNAQAAHLHRKRFRAQARTLALRARHHRHVLLDLLADVVGVRLLVAPLQVGDDPLEAGGVRAPPPVAVAVRDVDAVAVRAEQEAVLGFLLQLLPRRRRGRSRSARRSPASSGRSSSTHWSTTAGSPPRRASGRDPAPRARDRSPSASRGRCSAGTRRAAS